MMEKCETTKLLQQLVAIPSPYFEERAIMDFAADWLTERDLSPQRYQYHESKITDFRGENLYLTVEGGMPGPVLHLNGHLDTVTQCKGWTRAPRGEMEGDLLYGVGALDMKAGCAATMVALEHFHRDFPVFRGTIKASFVSVEEGPFGMGTDALLEAGLLDDVDLSIVAEPSAGFTGKPFPTLCLGARGGYGLNIDFHGKAAHAASPEQGINAAADMAAVAVELGHVNFREDPRLGKGTCCVAAMEANGGACSVPDFATMRIFWHIVVGEDVESIVSDIEAAIRRADIRSSYTIRFRETPSEGSRGFMPYTVEPDHPQVRAFQAAVEKVMGKQAEIAYFQSVGDFNYLGTRLEAPALIFGPAGARFHGQDECVELESVWSTARVLYEFLADALAR